MVCEKKTQEEFLEANQDGVKSKSSQVPVEIDCKSLLVNSASNTVF
jgi:hypothetical protein